MKDTLKEILPSLRKFAFSLTGNLHDADDLLQNTVEKLLQKPVPDDVPVLAWSFRVCRNLWIDEYRANKVRQAAVNKPELQEPVQHDAEKITASLTLRQVTDAMEELPDDHRDVLSLVAVQGMSYREASEVLSVPSGTIMSRLARARARLADVLKLTPEAFS
ncbi:RNA polymerase sigma factor [Alteromonas sp. ASW11-19]|uniref:RNA polymerase sigma factor n=1 Tax=Alteromonas salexigens TaxID=2982530 RepID=A0ABT2VJM8_9ALTE|nr:RNA polymerase sigma factor [Alteromonas salexigens]MCU7553416.1 RNA polymerase sigma factor [Alteromonas salexigens]